MLQCTNEEKNESYGRKFLYDRFGHKNKHSNTTKQDFKMQNNNNKRNGGTISSDSRRSKKNIKTKRRFPIFPQKLYDMLENAETNGYSHIISWLPNGKAFQIRGDEQAIVEVLRQCADFNLTRFKSFSRQLQLYGFERNFKGERQGECKHSWFIRGRKDLFEGKSMIHSSLH